MSLRYHINAFFKEDQMPDGNHFPVSHQMEKYVETIDELVKAFATFISSYNNPKFCYGLSIGIVEESTLVKEEEIKTSDDFENDPNAALDALSKTGFAMFVISEKWFDDPRAQKEWRFAKDMNKPMVYILDKTKKYDVENKFLFEYPHLIGTINDYGDTEKTANYLRAMIEAFKKNSE